MKPPIILDNRGDLSVFQDPEEALAYAEVVDVEAGEYKAFDAEGRLLTLGTGPGGRYGNKKVIIVGVEERPDHQQELRNTLVDFMRRAGASPDPNAPLPALIRAVAASCNATIS
jgi:hypothetical protein